MNIFAGKTAIVTGAASGIGRALACEFARQGGIVAVSGRRRERLDEVVAEIEKGGGKALAVPCDVTDEGSLRSAVDRIVQELGRLDVAVANAGFAVRGSIEKLTAERWRRQLDVNVVGAAMTAPEVSCAFQRCGLPFHCVVGGDFQEKVWVQVGEWIEAAATRRALMDSRLGYLGHYYPGMLDMHSDFTMHQGRLGAHVEILEMCDLADRVARVSDAEIEAKVAETKEMFHMPPPGADRVTEQVDPEDLRWAAQVACAEDRLAADFNLDGLAYYYRGWDDNEYERIAAAMILGNSMLTARGIPCAGEADLKTCAAMFIQDHFGAGGSFCELYLLDFEGGFVVAGHDGPGHLGICDQKPILRGMKLFHGKAGHGVSVEFNVKNGPVTMLGVTQTCRTERHRPESGQGVDTRSPEYPLRARVRWHPDRQLR